MTRVRESVAVAAVLMAFAAAAAAFSLGLSPRARLAPLIVAVVTLILLGVEAAASTSGRRLASGGDRTGAAQSAPAPNESAREGAMLGWLAVLLALLFVLGMAIALPAYLFLYLRLRAGQSRRFALAFALVLWIVLSLGMQMLLGVRLHEGWLPARIGLA